MLCGCSSPVRLADSTVHLQKWNNGVKVASAHLHGRPRGSVTCAGAVGGVRAGGAVAGGLGVRLRPAQRVAHVVAGSCNKDPLRVKPRGELPSGHVLAPPEGGGGYSQC